MTGSEKPHRSINHPRGGRLWAGQVGCAHATESKLTIGQAVGMRVTRSPEPFGQMTATSAKQTSLLVLLLLSHSRRPPKTPRTRLSVSS